MDMEGGIIGYFITGGAVSLLTGLTTWYTTLKKLQKASKKEELDTLTDLRNQVDSLYERIHKLYESLLNFKAKINELEIQLQKKNVALADKIELIKQLKAQIIELETLIQAADDRRN